jgi:NAD(P)H-flavin reductase/ferredoxin
MMFNSHSSGNFFSFFKKEPKYKEPHLVSVNGQEILVLKGENILSAALRQGINFPYSCRVGGCASCKCKLVSGEVKELTETGYLLSEAEINDGYILACQSVPRSDISIEVSKLNQDVIRGTVKSQRKLNHDIIELKIKLEQTLGFKAGQYVSLSLDSLPDTERNYSMASPIGRDNIVTFFIRRVPGGKFTNFIFENKLVGKTASIKGPFGEFYLRKEDSPLLLVAGGSGLSPIMAILKEALASKIKRPVTLVFGARSKKDLYYLEEIKKIQKSWPVKFEFIPVLSQEKPGSDWKGKRGLVTDILNEVNRPGMQAYLCGPPIMVDSCSDFLIAQGFPKSNLFADRFTTLHTQATESVSLKDSKPRAGFLHYFKFALFHLIALGSAVSILAGGAYITLGLIALLTFYILGDSILGDDTTVPFYDSPQILTYQLWMALPLLLFVVFCSIWSVSASDPLGFGAWISTITGYDLLGARAMTSPIHYISTWIFTGLMIGLVGTITAHELTHLTWDKASMLIGRWLLAFSFDTIFSIEHVYGHHRYVSTKEDPATAPRGRNVYYHILASTFKGNLSAWHIEVKRLHSKKHSIFSYHNAFLRGHLMSLILVFLAYLLTGINGMFLFIASALLGKALLEIVNYMEHYGMVRLPEEPVQPRHSWNTNRRLSSWTMFNLTRHSHHHAQGEVPFHELKPYPEAPMMIHGYLTTIVIALVPPIWFKLMAPKVKAWDEKYASKAERALVGGLKPFP